MAGLDPAVGYTFAVGAPGFLSQTYPATGTLTPAIGSNTTANDHARVTQVDQRTDVQVRHRHGVERDPAARRKRDRRADADRGGRHLQLLGLGYGTYTVRASAPGVGATQLTGIVVAAGQAPPVNQDITLSARQMTVQFTILPAAAAATNPVITVNGAAGTPGQTSFTFAEDGNLAFTVVATGYDPGGGTVVIPANWDGTSTVTASATLTLTPPPAT